MRECAAWHAMAGAVRCGQPQLRTRPEDAAAHLPAIFFCRIMSTTTPHASRACSCPTKPDAIGRAVPSSFNPSPLMWVWVATRCCLEVLDTSSMRILANWQRLAAQESAW